MLRAAPEDADLVKHPVPAHTRHTAIGAARTAAECDIVYVQMLAGFIEELEFVDETLGQGFGGETFGFDLVGRFVLEFPIGFYAISDPDGVVAIHGVAFVKTSGGLVQIIGVAPALKVLPTDLVHFVWCETLGHDDEAVEAGLPFGNADTGEVHIHAEELVVEDLVIGNHLPNTRYCCE